MAHTYRLDFSETATACSHTEQIKRSGPVSNFVAPRWETKLFGVHRNLIVVATATTGFYELRQARQVLTHCGQFHQSALPAFFKWLR